jgi:hypothetical protein
MSHLTVEIAAVPSTEVQYLVLASMKLNRALYDIDEFLACMGGKRWKLLDVPSLDYGKYWYELFVS